MKEQEQSRISILLSFHVYTQSRSDAEIENNLFLQILFFYIRLQNGTEWGRIIFTPACNDTILLPNKDERRNEFLSHLEFKWLLYY